jgi:hypothetical protein
VFDPGINAFSIATRIFPGALFVKSAELLVPENAQTPIAAEVTLHSSSGEGALSASLDWRRSRDEEWTITVKAADGAEVRLEDGGATLLLNGEKRDEQGVGEYPDIYREFIDLIDARRSDVDVAPLRLVADCLLAGRRRGVEAVHG